jgi:acyl-coenzyme A thioesterase PaaI-like protein
MISASRTRSMMDNVQFQATCFACGSDNAQGLQLKFDTDPDGTVKASFIPGPTWEGPRGIVHGGIVTTLLDEAMAKAVAATGYRGMTAELQVRFRQYAETGEQLQVRGWVVRHKTRLIEAEAMLLASDGSERAHAWAKFLVVVNRHPPGPEERVKPQADDIASI